MTATFKQELINIRERLNALEDHHHAELKAVMDAGGYAIAFTKVGQVVGFIGLTKDGALGLGSASSDSFSESDGGIKLNPGSATIYGSVVNVNSLGGDGPRQVYCDPDGSLYAVDPPPPAWSDSDTDTGDYPLDDLGTWVRMTGLEAVVQVDVPAGNVLSAFASIHCVNDSSRMGSIDLGLGIGNAQPTTPFNSVIPDGFDSSIPINVSSSNHGGLTAGQTVTIWGRRATQEHAQFSPVLEGSTGIPHTIEISVSAG